MAIFVVMCHYETAHLVTRDFLHELVFVLTVNVVVLLQL